MPAKIRQTSGQEGYPDTSFQYDTLSYVRSVFVSFAQGLFYVAPQGYQWKPDVESTEIIITDESPINLEVIGKRPAIGFTRGPVQAYNFSIGDMDTYDMATGAKTKAILVAGSMSINVCSRVDLESERLAWILAEQMHIHREYLMKHNFFDIARNWVVGAPSPAGSIVSGDQGDEWYCTVISMPFQIHRNSLQVPLNRTILNSFEANVTASLNKNVNPQGPISAEGANAPYSVQGNIPGSPRHLQPHPLNPTQQVLVRSAHPYRQGLRPLSHKGRTIPTTNIVVEESGERTKTVQKVRI